MPNAVLREIRHYHDIRHCPWGDTVHEVAWMVWHSPDLFEEMKETVSCDLEPVSERSDKGARIGWFRWLAAINEEETAYNMHALWLWYFKAKIQPLLEVSSPSTPWLPSDLSTIQGPKVNPIRP